jgi:hypothetical protein
VTQSSRGASRSYDAPHQHMTSAPSSDDQRERILDIPIARDRRPTRNPWPRQAQVAGRTARNAPPTPIAAITTSDARFHPTATSGRVVSSTPGATTAATAAARPTAVRHDELRLPPVGRDFVITFVASQCELRYMRAGEAPSAYLVATTTRKPSHDRTADSVRLPSRLREPDIRALSTPRRPRSRHVPHRRAVSGHLSSVDQA